MLKEVGAEGLNVLPLLTRPAKVAIVALGPSSMAFVREMMSTQNMKSPFDEVWAINRGFRGFPHDKLFLMDDLRWLEKKDNAYAEALKSHDKPIFTSKAYSDYPQAVEYPFEPIKELLGDDIFASNTVSYAVAYAIYIKVKTVYLYGADFVYPNGATTESGGMSVAFLLGMMRAFEMQFVLPGETTMLYANTVKQRGELIRRPYYGYHRQDEMKKEEKENAVKSKSA